MENCCCPGPPAAWQYGKKKELFFANKMSVGTFNFSPSFITVQAWTNESST